MTAPPKPIDPRRLAFDILDRVAGGGYADRTLDAALQRHPQLDPRDRGLLTELVYGVLRQQGRLDYALAAFCKQPLTKLENRVLRDTCTLVRGALYTFPVQRQSLSDWLRKSVTEHRTIIRLAAARDGEALGAYFRDVHWDFEQNRRFIVDAFDRHGEAAVHL